MSGCSTSIPKNDQQKMYLKRESKELASACMVMDDIMTAWLLEGDNGRTSTEHSTIVQDRDTLQENNRRRHRNSNKRHGERKSRTKIAVRNMVPAVIKVATPCDQRKYEGK